MNEQVVVVNAFRKMPARCREAILLLHSGQTYTQIAARLNIDEALAHRLVSRALEYLLEQVLSIPSIRNSEQKD